MKTASSPVNPATTPWRRHLQRIWNPTQDLALLQAPRARRMLTISSVTLRPQVLVSLTPCSSHIIMTIITYMTLMTPSCLLRR